MGIHTEKNSNTVKLLAKKHSEIQDNIRKAEAKLLTMKNTLHSLEVSIHLFNPDYKTSNIVIKKNVFNALKRLRDQGIICEAGRSGKSGALLWRLSS